MLLLLLLLPPIKAKQCDDRDLSLLLSGGVEWVDVRGGEDWVEGAVRVPSALPRCGPISPNCLLSIGLATFNASGYVLPSENREKEIPIRVELDVTASFKWEGLEQRSTYGVELTCNISRSLLEDTAVPIRTYETIATAPILQPPSHLQVYMSNKTYYPVSSSPLLTFEYGLINNWTSPPQFNEGQCLGLSRVCPVCRRNFGECEQKCGGVVGRTAVSLVAFYYPLMHQSEWGPEELRLKGATHVACAVRGIAAGEVVGEWSEPVIRDLSPSEWRPAPRLGLAFYLAPHRTVFIANLDVALPVPRADGVFTGLRFTWAQAYFKDSKKTHTSVKKLNHPVRLEYECCEHLSPVTPRLVTYESDSPEMEASFPPGQFQRSIPDVLVGDFCMDYVAQFHYETRRCQLEDPTIRCIFMVDDVSGENWVGKGCEKMQMGWVGVVVLVGTLVSGNSGEDNFFFLDSEDPDIQEKSVHVKEAKLSAGVVEEEAEASGDEKGSLSTSAIAGIAFGAIGGLVLLALIAAVALDHLRQPKTSQGPTQSPLPNFPLRDGDLSLRSLRRHQALFDYNPPPAFPNLASLKDTLTPDSIPISVTAPSDVPDTGHSDTCDSHTCEFDTYQCPHIVSSATFYTGGTQADQTTTTYNTSSISLHV